MGHNVEEATPTAIDPFDTWDVLINSRNFIPCGPVLRDHADKLMNYTRIALECGRVDWEEEALKGREKGARVAITRFGIVLGERGGALSQMIPLFKNYLGGPIGSGRQWFSWIHIQDLEEAIAFLMSHPEVSGPVNFCAPNPVRNEDLAKALGKALDRPSLLRAPAFAVRLVLGEFGSVLLAGQRVTPRKLLDHGFLFRYPEIEGALESLTFK